MSFEWTGTINPEPGPYLVINTRTEESHGNWETLSQAFGCVRFDRLTSYQIWNGDVLIDERVAVTGC